MAVSPAGTAGRRAGQVTLRSMVSSRAGDDALTRLALAAKAGDRAAATAFIEATQRDVRRFLTHLVGRGEAEDLTQETYLRAMRPAGVRGARHGADLAVGDRPAGGR